MAMYLYDDQLKYYHHLKAIEPYVPLKPIQKEFCTIVDVYRGIVSIARDREDIEENKTFRKLRKLVVGKVLDMLGPVMYTIDPSEIP